ncbi:hypothetical protein [Brevundimonas sp. Root1279]|uniref:hypothetical protein n=1 Tax=Brevundimonas sp. Root1279 TaxID=1736443 RepID=UPI0006FAD695|nr:hypothetical protein [Brevundimonas sp. Root1279]KQW86746.1 hypothetical protein ASC65_02355 [Brevundimonas sp. Root1279]
MIRTALAPACIALAALVAGCEQASPSKDAPAAAVEVAAPAAPPAAPAAPAAPSAAPAGATAIVFPAGATGTTVHGSVRGEDTVYYRLNARQGQTARIAFAPSNTSAYFNVFAPGVVPGEGEALFIGASGGNDWQAVLPASGDYTVQVYLYRNAARRNESSDYSMEVSVR